MFRLWLIHALISWGISAAALKFTSALLPSFRLQGIGSALIATFVLGALNATLLRILWVVTLPFTVITLGLFLLVLNGAMLKLTAALVRGFSIDGWWAAIGGSIILTIVQSLFFYFYRRVFE
ncbi:MAG: phage holin family protein [Bdellovibrionota bacterium]